LRRGARIGHQAAVPRGVTVQQAAPSPPSGPPAAAGSRRPL